MIEGSPGYVPKGGREWTPMQSSLFPCAVACHLAIAEMYGLCTLDFTRQLPSPTIFGNVNPGLINHGLLIRGHPPIVIIQYLNGTPPMVYGKNPVGHQSHDLDPPIWLLVSEVLGGCQICHGHHGGLHGWRAEMVNVGESSNIGTSVSHQDLAWIIIEAYETIWKTIFNYGNSWVMKAMSRYVMDIAGSCGCSSCSFQMLFCHFVGDPFVKKSIKESQIKIRCESSCTYFN